MAGDWRMRESVSWKYLAGLEGFALLIAGNIVSPLLAMGLLGFNFFQISAFKSYGSFSGFSGLCYKGGCDGDLATGRRWFFDIWGAGKFLVFSV